MATSQHRAIALAIFALAGLLASSFLAQALVRFGSVWFLPLDAEGIVALAPRAAGVPVIAALGPERRDPERILRRNIFDSATGDVLRVAETVAENVDAEEGAPEEWDPTKPLSPCAGNLRLVGSLVHTRHLERSFAAITQGSDEARLFRPASEVDGQALLAVRTSSVVLRPRNGPPCQLSMFDPGPSAPTAARAPAVAALQVPEESPATSADSGDNTQALDEGITKVNDTQYTLRRSLVDSLLEDQTALMKLARVIPHQENGRTVGVKLYGIRRNSVLGRLGIQNGDMLRTINGFDMADATGALEAFAKLRNADQLSISLVRRGNPQTLEYQIQ